MPADFLVFLSVLAVVTVLIVIGHTSPQEMAGYATAATALFAAWRSPRDGGPRGGS
ncbi:hypothetical protein ACWEPM_24380 [Streptomyces sp. NPDC004244]|uniref:hypothetical protein n=1 Tax=Streptomyces sp. NPDC101206 TaxID=3366128 RepID=UPI0037FE39F4